MLVRLDRRPDDVRTAGRSARCADAPGKLVRGCARTRPGHRHARRHRRRRRADRRRVRRRVRSGSPTTPASTPSCSCRAIVAACDEAGVALADLAAVVTGVGPGPVHRPAGRHGHRRRAGRRARHPRARRLLARRDRARARRRSSSSPTPAAARSTGPPTTPTAAAPTARTSSAPAVLVERLPDVRAAAARERARSPACPWSARPPDARSAWSPSPPTRCARASCRARWSRSTCAAPTPGTRRAQAGDGVTVTRRARPAARVRRRPLRRARAAALPRRRPLVRAGVPRGAAGGPPLRRRPDDGRASLVGYAGLGARRATRPRCTRSASTPPTRAAGIGRALLRDLLAVADAAARRRLPRGAHRQRAGARALRERGVRGGRAAASATTGPAGRTRTP